METRTFPACRELEVKFRSLTTPLPETPALRTSRDLAAFLQPLLQDEATEVFGVLALSTRLEPLAWHVVARGSLREVLASPASILRAVLLTPGATAFVVAHCHPSGRPDPSHGDLQHTLNLLQAAQVCDLDLLDHIIVGAGTYYSMNESKQLRL